MSEQTVFADCGGTPYTISTRTARLPIDTAFRIIPPEKHKPNLYPFTIYDGKIIAYSRLFATPLVRSMIQAAAQEGSEFYDGLSVEHYSNFPLSGSILSNTGFGPPGQNPFCYMICSIMDRENIDSNKFMERKSWITTFTTISVTIPVTNQKNPPPRLFSLQ